jgi:lipoic acid synthetase
MPEPGMLLTEGILTDLRLQTVCESARCPNRTECWSQQTATFMILGNVCTRPCGFCSVPKGKTETVESDEPQRLAEAARRLGLSHVVITSVTRDDLPDGGADHFYHCVLAVRELTGAAVEVLTPDFLGNNAAIDRVLQASPDVFNHNTETVPRLYHRVRRNAEYQRTLDLLARVRDRRPEIPTKSGLMLGLGETLEEVLEVCASTCSPRPNTCRWNDSCRRRNSTRSGDWCGSWDSAWSPAGRLCVPVTTPVKWPASGQMAWHARCPVRPTDGRADQVA